MKKLYNADYEVCTNKTNKLKEDNIKGDVKVKWLKSMKCVTLGPNNGL
jgi:hypothetical protein